MTHRKSRKQLSPVEVKFLDKASEQIDNIERKSKQELFNPAKDSKRFFWNLYSLYKSDLEQEPTYSVDSRKRDSWLRSIVAKEPFLNGVLNSVITIDKNRGWNLVGGKTQVNKFASILHGFNYAPGVAGWRGAISQCSMEYYISDLGTVVEVGTNGKNGALDSLYTVDSARCKLTGDNEFPLIYQDETGKEQPWAVDEFFRLNSLPSTDQKMFGLGYCAISRCLEFAKVLFALYEHDREKLGARAPKGLLLLSGITEQQWVDSLKEAQAEATALERKYYSGVQVLAGSGLTPIQANLLSLSNIPENLDHQTFTNMIMYGYAMQFGYDPREFWPVSGGQLGTATETEQQHKKATGKGGLDFILGFQEKIQQELPETLEFEFEQRDVDGEIQDSSAQSAKLSVINSMYQSSNPAGETLIDRIEARILLAEQGLIPEEWTVSDEQVTVSDEEDQGEMLEKHRIQRALELFPDEDIVRYNSITRKTKVIFHRKSKFMVQVARKKALYKKGRVVITEDDVRSAIRKGSKRTKHLKQFLLAQE